ncbi:hypothetical protein [Traorella massiliensis]|uniref:hypothetical protein n=1 Tax=Traorella massiliensis TaxID=1903263 RepID=UPI0023528737|nr:hypothetical protein [Traorella massiliensis]
MKKSIFSRFMKALTMEIREHKSTFIVYSVLRLAVIAVGILQFFNGNYENVFLCILTLILLMVPSFIQLTFKVELPTTLEIIILLFIFAAEILGEIDDYYLLFPFWDTMLHTINGFLAAAIGFSLVTLLNDSEKIQFELSPIFVVIVAFCFSMTIGVVWEFFEFGMDQIFGMDTQKDTIIHILNSVSISADGSMTTFRDIGNVVIDGTALPFNGYLDIGLIDTMQDLIVNFIGASVFSVFGFFYIKFKGKINLVNRFIPTKKSKDRDYLEKVINDAE